ncbi:MAG: hypothetical protein ABIK09_08220 [Pseudomonadota bacterium]
MRGFVKKVLLFTLLQGILLAALAATYRPETTGYLAAGLDKRRLATETRGPRVLLVGGSSVAFGFDSAALEADLGKPVINLGGQGSQGLEFRLREALALAREGDVVVLSLEYQVLLGKDAALGLTLWRTLESDPAAARFTRWGEWKRLLDDGHLFLRHALRRSVRRGLRGRWPESDAPYRRDSCNAHGDVVAHHTMEPPGYGNEAFQLRFSETDLARAVDRLGSFSDAAAARGVRVMIFYPSVPEERAQPLLEDLERVDAQLREALEIPVLNRPEEGFRPPADFFNSTYHLTGEAGAAQTQLLAARLKPLL